MAALEQFSEEVNNLLRDIRKVNISGILPVSDISEPLSTFQDVLQSFSSQLLTDGFSREAEALEQALDRSMTKKSQGGLGIFSSDPLTPLTNASITFQVEAFLETLNSEDNARKLLKPLHEKPDKRRPMTLSQKIFAQHAIGKIPEEGLGVGDLVRVAVDWVISSELSWEGLAKVMKRSNTESIFRNDRLWIAGDHIVDPKNYHSEMSQRLIKSSEKAEKDYRLTEYKGTNYTIMHTEFVREKAQPGMLIVGADSHTCSSGAVGCLSIGLGTEDVVMPLITGETWFKVPECLSIIFDGEPLPGIGGKDVILYILKELKRSTVAANRIVEFSGPGVKHLSIDARFAICNMCTEFGAVTGVFVPDEETLKYINRRKLRKQRTSSVYFCPDLDAQYAETFTINLSNVKPFVAIYPSPDNVISVTEQIGKPLDGCFIGACTTTEEDLVLAALVIRAGLARNLPLASGKRQVSPGSMPIVDNLQALGLLEDYKKAGFIQGPPGCSYCVGIADTAKPGSVWLSSQNRNFPNRMGKGSFANIASAVTVAASSFSMTLSDPTPFLENIDMEIWNKFKNMTQQKVTNKAKQDTSLSYVEPNFQYAAHSAESTVAGNGSGNAKDTGASLSSTQATIRSKVTTLRDFVDTDALAPSEYFLTATTDEQLADHCLEHTDPDFRTKVRNGQKVVVAGTAFGCGSSRETAPRALKGLGVQAVIARSFAFIYARNSPNIGLLGIVLDDDDFHKTAVEGVEIEIDLQTRKVKLGQKEWEFKMDDLEVRLIENGGMGGSYRKWGKEVFGKLAAGEGSQERDLMNLDVGARRTQEDLGW